MNWLRNARPVLLAAGGLLLVGSLLGARLLAPGGGGGTASAAAPATNGTGSGPVVLGFVDSDPGPVAHGLPPVLQSGEVAQVFVKAGDEVKADAPLYRFNTRYLETQVAKAQELVKSAKAGVEVAKARQAKHKADLATQELRLNSAVQTEATKKEGQRIYDAQLKAALYRDQPDRAKADQQFEDDLKRFELRNDVTKAGRDRDIEQIALNALKAVDTEAEVKLAEARVGEAQAALAEAKQAVELCTVRALLAGTVERVNVGPGDVMGVGTRVPAVVLVPAGRRVVRAEVEAEFAHRVGKDKEGKEVVIHDHSDPKLTYKGTVRRVGDAFLPKRGTDGGFVPNETKVLEALVEVADPAPAGKPPLRVGQKVKVNFGP